MQLVIGKLELADQVADLECSTLACEDVTERVDAVDHLGEVLLLVQIRQLELEKVWQADPVDESKEVVDVVRVAILELGVDKDAGHALWLELFGELGEEDTVSHFVLHLDNVTEVLADVEFHPFLGLSTVTEVLVCLKEMALRVHPFARACQGEVGGGSRRAT